MAGIDPQYLLTFCQELHLARTATADCSRVFTRSIKQLTLTAKRLMKAVAMASLVVVEPAAIIGYVVLFSVYPEEDKNRQSDQW